MRNIPWSKLGKPELWAFHLVPSTFSIASCKKLANRPTPSCLCWIMPPRHLSLSFFWNFIWDCTCKNSESIPLVYDAVCSSKRLAKSRRVTSDSDALNHWAHGKRQFCGLPADSQGGAPPVSQKVTWPDSGSGRPEMCAPTWLLPSRRLGTVWMWNLGLFNNFCDINRLFLGNPSWFPECQHLESNNSETNPITLWRFSKKRFSQLDSGCSL